VSVMDRRDDEARRRLKARNLALLLALAAFAIIVYIVSIVRMGGH
jgi:hypothetical protein